jgi:hypothetical protein
MRRRDTLLSKMSTTPPFATSEAPPRGGLVPKIIFFVGVCLLLSVGLVGKGSFDRDKEARSQAVVEQAERAAEAAQKTAEEAIHAAKAVQGKATNNKTTQDEVKQAAEAAATAAKAAQDAAVTVAKAAEDTAAVRAKVEQPVPDVHVIMQVLVSVALLSATLFVVLSKKYAAKDKHWAYTTIGLIIGFWLKP